MSRPLIGSDQGGQLALLPVDVREVLPPDHRVWQVLAQVEEFDLGPFLGAYRADGVGRPPYHPRVIIALIVYCYGKRQRTLREITTACRDDLGARVIVEGRVPSISTLSEFMKTHRDPLRALLAQTVAMGEVEGLVDLSLVAGDGTKMNANAAMTATTDESGLRAQITDLEHQIQATAAVWADRVAAHPAAADPGTPGPGLFDLDADPADPGPDASADPGPDDPAGPVADPVGGLTEEKAWRRLRVLTRLLDSRREALAWLVDHPPVTALADWQERLERDQERVAGCERRVEALRARLTAVWQQRRADEAGGKVFRGPPMTPVERHSHLRREQQGLDKARARAATTAADRPAATRVNTTDPWSRIMPGKHDGYDQRYNVQALACKNQFILAVCLHDSPNDKQALRALLTAARANLDAAGIARAIRVALFDAGYISEANITATDLPVDLLLIAVEKEARQAGRRRDGVSTQAPRWQAMADLLADPANTALYKRRGAIIEPLFAQLFDRFGRDLTTRGDSVETELHLWAVTHNLDKITRARARKRSA